MLSALGIAGLILCESPKSGAAPAEPPRAAAAEPPFPPAEPERTVGPERTVEPDYLELKEDILREFAGAKPGRFGQFVRGVYRKMDTTQKVLAFTFDACGGPGGRGYNAGLIDYLRKEKIPATLFITGQWIDENPAVFKQLASDPLFEIENHGLRHRGCSIDGETRYGVVATRDVGGVVDEIELNARKIACLTGRRPVFFRPATAYTDETCSKIAKRLRMEIVNYDVFSGDAEPFASASILRDNILRSVRGGAIVLMHFNHPRWNEKEALAMAVPVLRDMGYSFVKLEDFTLLDRQSRH